MKKRKKIRRKIKSNSDNCLPVNNTIIVSCWTPDIPDYEKEAYSHIWKAEPKVIKNFFNKFKKVHYKRVPIEVCIKKSKSKDPLHEECYGCTKYIKFLPSKKSVKKKKRKKIRYKL